MNPTENAESVEGSSGRWTDILRKGYAIGLPPDRLKTGGNK